MAYAIGKEACPKCRASGRDRAGDNLVIYSDQGKVCFACDYVEYSKDWKEKKRLGISFDDEREEIMDRTSDKIISKKENEELKSKTGHCDFRGVRSNTWKQLGVRFTFDQETGEPTRQYYPTTLEGKLAGYKRRDLPKEFGTSLGETGAVCDFFGAFLKKPSQKTLIIVGGEIDQASVHQVLDDYAARRDYDYANMLVVSPTTGENCSRQVKNNHKWLSSFDEIKVGLDNDDAGKDALKKVLKALPNVKVSVIEWTKKDPNEMLLAGMEKDILNCIYNSRVNVSANIKGSSSLFEEVRKEGSAEKLSLPPFMKKVSEAMGGGIPLNNIINLGSNSGCVDGETEFFNGFGWTKIKDYKEGQMVGQWTNGILQMVTPLAYVVQDNPKLNRVTNGSVDIVVSDDHNMLYETEHYSRNRLKEVDFKYIRNKHESTTRGFRGRLLTTFNIEDNAGISFTDGELRLQVAVMADGRVVREGKDNYTQMRFRKKRKYDRLISLCKSHSLRYDDRGVNNQGQYEVIVWPKCTDKKFTSKYYTCSKHQLQVILDEIGHWDGYINPKGLLSYSSRHKSDVDFIQYALAAMGSRGSIYIDKRDNKYTEGEFYEVNETKTSRPTLAKDDRRADKEGRNTTKIVDFYPEDGKEYCFRVPSGFLVLRRDNKIFITGNTGKTTVVNEAIYHWLFNSPYPVGVVSMELSSAQYGEVLLSRHLGKKIALFQSVEEKEEYLARDDVKAKAQELFTKNGSDRFYLVDELDGDINNLKRLVEELIIKCGCKVICIDPMSDALDGLTNEDQALFMKWQKQIRQKYNIIFINICHLRKTAKGIADAETGLDILYGISEEDFQGSSAIFKSGSANILFARAKRSDDNIIKNTTFVMIDKIRWTGNTGLGGEWYYDNNTHTMYDKDEYFNKTG